MKTRTILFLLFSLLVSLPAVAQHQQRQMRRHLLHGNKEYRDSIYDKSEVSYLKAISKDSTNAVAQYNLSCAMLRSGTGADTIMQTLQKAVRLEKDRSRQARMFHNMGWLCQSAHANLKNRQGFEGKADSVLRSAIECYKEALRRNPNDDETRYNLVLCQRQLPKNNGDSGGGDGGQDQQQDEQKDQQQQQQQQEQEKQQPQEQKMSQQNAEQLLNAALQDERRTQDKMQKQDVQPARGRKLKKQW